MDAADTFACWVVLYVDVWSHSSWRVAMRAALLIVLWLLGSVLSSSCDFGTSRGIKTCQSDYDCRVGAICVPLESSSDNACVSLDDLHAPRVCKTDGDCAGGACATLEGDDRKVCVESEVRSEDCFFAGFHKRYSVDFVGSTHIIATHIDVEDCTMQFYEEAKPLEAAWHYVFSLDEKGDVRVYAAQVHSYVEVLEAIPSHVSFIDWGGPKGGGGGYILDFFPFSE